MRSRSSQWLLAAGALVVLAILAAAWKWTGLREWTDPERLAEMFEPYRASWLALPVVLVIFVVAELFLFPVLVLVFVCGLVFGPWLGSLYALTGSIVSAIVPFWIGRKLGRARLERVCGAWVRKLSKTLEKRGILAVFLVRKVPAPFTLVNMICGASPVSLRDFTIGTLLGMGTGVLLITIVGGQLFDILKSPEPGQIAFALAMLFAPLLVVFVVQRHLNRRMESES